jgi:hypothetical protein
MVTSGKVSGKSIKCFGGKLLRHSSHTLESLKMESNMVLVFRLILEIKCQCTRVSLKKEKNVDSDQYVKSKNQSRCYFLSGSSKGTEGTALVSRNLKAKNWPVSGSRTK